MSPADIAHELPPPVDASFSARAAPALMYREEDSSSEIAGLLRLIEPIAPWTTVAQAADCIQRPEYAALLSLPVVEGGVPMGTVSRDQLTRIFLHRFGRELFGARPVTEIMNQAPLVVEEATPLEEAAEYVAANLGTPITEDFIITRDDIYVGMGVALDLLGAMQRSVARNAERLAEAYTQLKSSQAALVQSEKMASLGQMVAGVAHEINTPLGYVRGNVEIVQDVFAQMGELLLEHENLVQMLSEEGGVKDKEALSQLLFRLAATSADFRESRMLEDAAALFGDTLFGVDTIKELVVNLRNFSRLDAARIARVNLNDCLDQTLVIATNLLRNRVEVIKRYGDIPTVSCSPSQMNQVLLNLITNAAQAIDHDNGKLLLKTEADETWVRISVQDNGRGIKPEHLPKIFDPFFTTKPVGQGTGLGLSISFQIVQAHGGTIQVVSVPEKGTRFVVSLPLQPHSEAEPADQH